MPIGIIVRTRAARRARKELIDENGIYRGKTFDHDDMHIVCPWHGYEFHLADGVHVADRRLRLQKFKVIERDGEVYVTI
jgi:nitrite reductase/ring-hydroxylating ferredoxin subunit